MLVMTRAAEFITLYNLSVMTRYALSTIRSHIHNFKYFVYAPCLKKQ